MSDDELIEAMWLAFAHGKEQMRAVLAVVRAHDRDGARYRFIKANLRRLDIAGLCITDITANQLDARVDAAMGAGG